ncbi:hypothetical protein STAFG_1189 [Streptomyces afghaniensis 772]|uniref:Uncharacterized protein n=1 Tax=Streptomyces afghaniensis 772 TaxID=1283301 RepID=S4MZZ9_9ACTN|nr:hypothetical protein STAFG_1189 [Streptomyces afghaniensis 772]
MLSGGHRRAPDVRFSVVPAITGRPVQRKRSVT